MGIHENQNVHNLPVPNLEAMREHLEHLFGGCHEGLIELAWTSTKKDSAGRYRLNKGAMFGTDKLEELAQQAVHLNTIPNCNVYIGAALRKSDTFPGGRAEDDDVLALTCLYVDLDDEGSPARARDVYQGAKPTLIVVTGRAPYTRAQCWWRLVEPIKDMAAASSALSGMATALGGDPTVTNPSRVMRLAGSIAWPMKPGRQVEPTYIHPVKEPGPSSYALEQMARLTRPADVHAHDAYAAHMRTDGAQHDAFGFDEAKLDDGRDVYARNTVEAVLIQLIGETGACPTAQEVYDVAWPQFQAHAKVINSEGKIKDGEFIADKCDYAVRRFQAGKIRGLPDIDAAIASYRRKSGPNRTQPGEGFVHTERPPQPLALRSAFPITENEIPVRDWIIPGLLLKRNLSVLVAPPASGKSLLTLQLAIAVALGLAWGGWHPRKPEKVLVINAEDDFDEMRRRLFAAAKSMGVNQADLVDRVLLAEAPESIVIAKMDSRSKSVIRTPLIEDLVATIIANDVGLVIADPFAETFEGDENSNSEVKWAGILWREVARRIRGSLLLVHHTKKYAGDMAGNQDASRGGGALIGTARILSTLFTMTEDEAKLFSIPPDERDQYVRFDDAKANHSAKGKVKWFRKITVPLNNGDGFIPGDDVGVLEPWQPPGVMDGVTARELGLALETIDRGVLAEDGRPTGQLFGPTVMSKDRFAGRVLEQMLGIPEERAKLMIKAWLGSGTLYTVEYDDPQQRKSRTGVKFDRNKRPDASPEVFE